jgi:hypothetical protein
VNKAAQYQANLQNSIGCISTLNFCSNSDTLRLQCLHNIELGELFRSTNPALKARWQSDRINLAESK